MLEKCQAGGKIVPELKLASACMLRWRFQHSRASSIHPNMFEPYISNPDDFVTWVNIIPEISPEMNKWGNSERSIPYYYCSLPNPCRDIRHLERVLGSYPAEADWNHAGTAGTKYWVVTRRIIWWFAAFIVRKVFTKSGSSILCQSHAKSNL